MPGHGTRKNWKSTLDKVLWRRNAKNVFLFLYIKNKIVMTNINAQKIVYIKYKNLNSIIKI